MAQVRSRTFLGTIPLLKTLSLEDLHTSLDAAWRTVGVIDAKGEMRLLQPMLLHAPTRKGQRHMCDSILLIRQEHENAYLAAIDSAVMRGSNASAYNQKESDFALQYQKKIAEALLQLHKYFECSLFLPILGNKTRVIERPSVGPDYYGKYPIDPCPRSDDREELLQRDKFTCYATGRRDLSLAKRMTSRPSDWNPVLTDYLEAAHIIPYFLNKFKLKKEKKMHIIIWKALEEFSGYDLSTLKGKGINHVSNIFMLCPSAHKMHDDLRLSFYPNAENVNEHLVKTYDKTADWLDVVKRVTFHKDINRDWIAIHHAMCEVLQDGRTYEEIRKLSDAA
ncbi:hypothetical protein BDQ12DRAFT_739367 [Crucibulum laeve]|uniref:HNH nuclease domain-containing protein n=1 Tax=Crucibulum laeve TaxID=68775 RepID=A0A5C3LIL5_9AGAR|nr:hypothetical protein BDQ12DRAFT_739367 [Crucibulum laeve]